MRYTVLFVVSLLLLSGFTCERKTEETSAPPPIVTEETTSVEETQQVVKSPEAFKAEIIGGTKWRLTLNPIYFGAAPSLAVHYNDIYYGIFLPNDTVYLPLLVADGVELLISALDADGKPVSTETFKLWREDGVPKIP